MKTYKRILAVILSLMMIISATVISASAEDSSDAIDPIKLNPGSDTYEGDLIPDADNGVKYTVSVPDGSSADEAYYVSFSVGTQSAYYTLTAKNLNMPTENGSVRVEIVNSEYAFGGIDLGLGEEKSVNIRTNAYFHAVKFYNSDNSPLDGGDIVFSLTRQPDPESDIEKKFKKVYEQPKSAGNYEGNIVVPEDVDWIGFPLYPNTVYKCTVETVNETKGLFLAELYTENGELISSSTFDEINKAEAVFSTSDEADVLYKFCIKSLDGSTGEYRVNYSPVTSYTNIRLLSWFNGILYLDHTEYVKFTTLNQDAYYDIEAYNGSIPTGESPDEYLQVELLDKDFNYVAKTTVAMEGTMHIGKIKLPANTDYYLKIYNGNPDAEKGGGYCLEINYDPDEDRGSREYAIEIELDQLVSGEVVIPYERDWYKITTADSKKYALMFKNKSDISIKGEGEDAVVESIRVFVVDEDDNGAATIVASGKTEYTELIELKPHTTYYLNVYDQSSVTAEYDLMLTEKLMLGDTNLDDNVKIQDATLIQKFVAKLAELEGKSLITADVNADGKINVKDATAIQKYIAKIEIPYNIGEYVL